MVCKCYYKWYMQYHIIHTAITTWSIFSKIFVKDTHKLPVRVRYGVSFVGSASDWYSASVSTMECEICYIGLRYNDTRLYWDPPIFCTNNWSFLLPWSLDILTKAAHRKDFEFIKYAVRCLLWVFWRNKPCLYGAILYKLLVISATWGLWYLQGKNRQ